MHSVMQCILLNGWNIWPWWLMKTQRVVHCPVDIKSVSVVSVFCPGPPVASLVNILVSITHWQWVGGALFLPVLSKNPWNCHAIKNSSIFYWAKFDWSWERWNVKVWQFSTSEWQKIWTRINGIVVQSLNKNQFKQPSSCFPTSESSIYSSWPHSPFESLRLLSRDDKLAAMHVFPRKGHFLRYLPERPQSPACNEM